MNLCGFRGSHDELVIYLLTEYFHRYDITYLQRSGRELFWFWSRSLLHALSANHWPSRFLAIEYHMKLNEVPSHQSQGPSY